MQRRAAPRCTDLVLITAPTSTKSLTFPRLRPRADSLTVIVMGLHFGGMRIPASSALRARGLMIPMMMAPSDRVLRRRGANMMSQLRSTFFLDVRVRCRYHNFQVPLQPGARARICIFAPAGSTGREGEIRGNDKRSKNNLGELKLVEASGARCQQAVNLGSVNDN